MSETSRRLIRNNDVCARIHTIAFQTSLNQPSSDAEWNSYFKYLRRHVLMALLSFVTMFALLSTNPFEYHLRSVKSVLFVIAMMPLPTSFACENEAEEVLILQQYLPSLFPNGFKQTGVFGTFNYDPRLDPEDIIASIIGALNPADYITSRGEYELRLKYWPTGYHPSAGEPSHHVSIRWAQSNWITEEYNEDTIRFREIGYEATMCPRITCPPQCPFTGLSISSSGECYLDGCQDPGAWWNCVGALQALNGGIPGYGGTDNGIFSGEELYICKPRITTTSCESGGEPVLILSHLDQSSYFPAEFLQEPGIGIYDDRDAEGRINGNLYLIIGSLISANYVTEYEFILEYFDPYVSLHWAQKNWITAADAIGYRQIAFEPSAAYGDSSNGDGIQGLRRSQTGNCYLEGREILPESGFRFACVGARDGADSVVYGKRGIAGYDYHVHGGQALYICR
eukprot:258795_1